MHASTGSLITPRPAVPAHRSRPGNSSTVLAFRIVPLHAAAGVIQQSQRKLRLQVVLLSGAPEPGRGGTVIRRGVNSQL